MVEERTNARGDWNANNADAAESGKVDRASFLSTLTGFC